MIPASSFQMNPDGTTALWVVPDEDHLPQHWERPCGTCNGSSLDLTPESIMQTFSKRMDGAPAGTVGVRPCPDCDGTGRHTFDIEVEHRDRLMHWPVTLTYSVHVIDVLPIVRGACPTPTNAEHRPAHVHMAEADKRYNPVDPDRSGICRENADLIWDSPWHAINAITLPPDAKPGMWAVLLDVHESEE